MKYLLSQNTVGLLTELSHKNTLCAFDFDGTLSPIVNHPDKACMRAKTRTLLKQLAALYPCVVITGRARPDILQRLDGIHLDRVIGNHGAESGVISHQKLDVVMRWKAALETSLQPLHGVWVEDKGLSLSVHYRQASDKRKSLRAIRAAVRKLDEAHAFAGKQVVNLSLKGALNKGDALAAQRLRLGCNCVLFVGDDENDEDAFALDGDVVAVRIGRKKISHARYYLRSQSEIDNLLNLLVQLRKATE